MAVKNLIIITMIAALSACTATKDGHPAIMLGNDEAAVIQHTELSAGASLANKSISLGIKVTWGKK